MYPSPGGHFFLTDALNVLRMMIIGEEVVQCGVYVCSGMLR